MSDLWTAALPTGSTEHLGLLASGAVIDLDGTFLIQLGIWFLLFFILRALVFKPALAVFEAREEAIDGAKKRAAQMEIDADERYQAFEAEMRKVRIASSAERDRIRQDAMRLERELLASARRDADQVTKQSGDDLKQDAARIRKELEAAMPQLAGVVASRVLGRDVSKGVS